MELLILRHAKASHDDSFDDHARPLTNKGKRTAARVGELLRERDLVPGAILSSSALRAKETAEIVIEHARFEGTFELFDELYLAEPGAYVTVLARRGGTHQRVMVVGHNPGLEALVEGLTGRSEHLPTGALALCRTAVESWADLALDGSASLAHVWRLKDED